MQVVPMMTDPGSDSQTSSSHRTCARGRSRTEPPRWAAGTCFRPWGLAAAPKAASGSTGNMGGLGSHQLPWVSGLKMTAVQRLTQVPRSEACVPRLVTSPTASPHQAHLQVAAVGLPELLEPEVPLAGVEGGGRSDAGAPAGRAGGDGLHGVEVLLPGGPGVDPLAGVVAHGSHHAFALAVGALGHSLDLVIVAQQLDRQREDGRACGHRPPSQTPDRPRQSQGRCLEGTAAASSCPRKRRVSGPRPSIILREDQ